MSSTKGDVMSGLIEMAKVAKKASNATTENMLEYLLKGIKKQARFIAWIKSQLPGMPSALSTPEAYQVYADSLHKSVERLTETEKTKAILEAVLERDDVT